MKFQYNDKTFDASDNCPIDKPPTRVLSKFIRDHGPEAFVTSEKYGRYAACVIGELLDSGAEIIDESTSDPIVIQESEGTVDDPVGTGEADSNIEIKEG